MTILFDLEGTLVKSMEDDQDAVMEFRIKTREMLVKLRIPSSELEGIGSSTLMRNKALNYVEEHFSEEEARRFNLETDRFLKNYELLYADRSEIFPDTLSILRRLKRLGYEMGIVPNTSKEGANRVLSKHGIETFFEVVITREDMKRLKPNRSNQTLQESRIQNNPKRPNLSKEDCPDLILRKKRM